MSDGVDVSPPRELRGRGLELWSHMVDALDFDAHEAAVLRDACRALDRTDLLQAALDADGPMVAGSRGNRVLHPAIAELRQTEAHIARLIGQLGLDAVDVQAAASAAWRARKAANQQAYRDRGAARA